MTEERDDVVVLLDENGDEQEFYFMDSIEMDGNEYVVLLPSEEEESEDEVGEVVILKLIHGDEEDSLVSIEDEDELQKVFDEFTARFEEDDEDE